MQHTTELETENQKLKTKAINQNLIQNENQISSKDSKIESLEKTIKRLKTVFGDKVKEFRMLVYKLFGYTLEFHSRSVTLTCGQNVFGYDLESGRVDVLDQSHKLLGLLGLYEGMGVQGFFLETALEYFKAG
jgi:hypothetical protein